MGALFSKRGSKRAGRRHQPPAAARPPQTHHAPPTRNQKSQPYHAPPRKNTTHEPRYTQAAVDDIEWTRDNREFSEIIPPDVCHRHRSTVANLRAAYERIMCDASIRTNRAAFSPAENRFVSTTTCGPRAPSAAVAGARHRFYVQDLLKAAERMANCWTDAEATAGLGALLRLMQNDASEPRPIPVGRGSPRTQINNYSTTAAQNVKQAIEDIKSESRRAAIGSGACGQNPPVENAMKQEDLNLQRTDTCNAATWRSFLQNDPNIQYPEQTNARRARRVAAVRAVRLPPTDREQSVRAVRPDHGRR